MSEFCCTKNTKMENFIKGSTDPKKRTPGCANFDHHYESCLYQDVCLVLEGKRCAYFERAVLPTGNSSIRQAYEDMTGMKISGPKVNLCGDCGKSIEPRHRFCGRCKKKRRQKTNRENTRAFRRKQRVSV